jgi:hypothetical protein
VTPTEQLRSFFKTHFPHSTVDDGYYFVAVRDGVSAIVQQDRRQEIVDRLTRSSETMLVSVGIDPRPRCAVNEVDASTIDYNPDWDVHVPRPRWIARIPTQHLELEPIYRDADATRDPCGFVLVDLKKRIIVDVLLRTIHAETSADLAAFLQGLGDAVVAP